jgi:hypothetical protein
MLEIKRPTHKPVVVIRAASGHELSNYEKNKLANIEENAQVNKIESIRINGKRVQIDAAEKEARINVGSLAFKNEVTPKELSSSELFFITCELSED